MESICRGDKTRILGDRDWSLRVLVKRRWLAVVVLVVVLGCLAFWNSRQRVAVVKIGTTTQQAKNRLVALAPISVGCLVLLDVNDFGYSAYVRAKADELSYDGFYARKGILSRGEAHDKRPLIISARTKAVVNLEQSSSALNAGPHPLLIDRLPWAYTTRGVPKQTDHHSLHPWLCHRLSVTSITNDGTVTITTGGKRTLLKPGGEVKIERAMGLWRSTVSIRHGGVFNKDKITQSKWLVVQRD